MRFTAPRLREDGALRHRLSDLLVRQVLSGLLAPLALLVLMVLWVPLALLVPLALTVRLVQPEQQDRQAQQARQGQLAPLVRTEQEALSISATTQ